MTAQRIQLSRAKGWCLPPNSRSVARPGIFGNPWVVGTPGRFWLRAMPACYMLDIPLDAAQAVAAFRLWLLSGQPPAHHLPSYTLFTATGREAMWIALDAQRSAILQAMPSLRDMNLACWCKPGCPCHADELLIEANFPAIYGAP